MATDIISFVSVASILLPIAFYGGKSESIKTSAYKVLLVAILVSLIAEGVYTTLGLMKVPNFTVGNIYAPVFFLLLVLFYRELLPSHRSKLYIFIAIYFVFLTVNALFIQDITEYQGYSRALGGVIMIGCSLLHFSSLMKNPPNQDIITYGPFWISAGIIFYFGFNLFLFVFSNFVFTTLEAEIGRTYWTFHNINNIVKNVLFAVGIYCAGKPRV